MISRQELYKDLLTYDHVYVVLGFQKSVIPSITSAPVQEILQRYLPPEKIVVHTDKSGKPRLQPVDGTIIYISIAHAADILLVAMSTDCDLGVDIEHVRNRKYLSRIAIRYFHKAIKDNADFYRAWTAREAFIKAISSRISESMARICTIDCDGDCLLGLTNEFSHRATFFAPRANFIAALCRHIKSKREYKIMR